MIGDSGTNRCTRTAATAIVIAPTMKSQRQETLSTISPDRTIPNPPPMPNTAETSPIATPSFSRGNSSRMIPKLRGKTAPPAPWIARATINAQMFQAQAAATEPTRKIARLITSRRSLPYWSPSLPRSGVATDATSRKTVSTQVTQVVVVCRSRCSVGRAGITIVCCSA